MAEKLWGGRFGAKDMDPEVMKFTSSLSVDNILDKYDCLASKVHVEMLEKCGFLSKDEKKELISALDEFAQKKRDGAIKLGEYEDIHSAVQSYVEKKCPDAGKKLHTARSRNEQVVNDVRLYCREMCSHVTMLIKALQKSIVELADKNIDVIVPGYTHLNHAQPVLFSHLLMAYVEMLGRDVSRINDAAERADMSVMGSGAIGGSSLDLDRKFVAERSGFASISANSIDAVSDRDFMIEILSAICMIAVHLSRIAEDLILYSTKEFDFIEIGEAYCTGSSLMPQKKNPDVLELIRGKSAGVIGALNSLFVLVKGLPHAYNRDLQEDKKFLFESAEVVAAELALMEGLMGSLKVNADKASEQLNDEFIYSTDLAEYLVAKGVAFKDAHRIIGNIVRHCCEKNINISDLSLPELKKFSAELDEDVYGLLNPETSVKRKKTYGSTNPGSVKKEISSWRKKLGR
ncbi:MAG TPA: argininosuccinate lyase [Candidatus Omnitrophota bacterium]|nr:argininosuccinate lyase [Candidatus Omnitrophota bacterium]